MVELFGSNENGFYIVDGNKWHAFTGRGFGGFYPISCTPIEQGDSSFVSLGHMTEDDALQYCMDN